jgi:hypothetical protein
LTPEQRIERAHRAERALDEFIRPALDTIRADYLEKLRVVAVNVPLHTDTVAGLSLALRIVDVIGGQLEAAIKDGEVAAKDREYGRKVVEMTASDRRLLQMAARRA